MRGENAPGLEISLARAAIRKADRDVYTKNVGGWGLKAEGVGVVEDGGADFACRIAGDAEPPEWAAVGTGEARSN